MNTIGLIIDFAGVILLFFYGPPSTPYTKDGGKILPVGDDDPAVTESNRKEFKKNQCCSRLALGLIALGLVFQILASVSSNSNQSPVSTSSVIQQATPTQPAAPNPSVP